MENKRFRVILQDLKTKKIFEKYYDTQKEVKLFVNKVIRGKKLAVLQVKDLYEDLFR
jgi:hypothetical protein